MAKKQGIGTNVLNKQRTTHNSGKPKPLAFNDIKKTVKRT